MKKQLILLGITALLTGCTAVAPYFVSDEDEKKIGQEYHGELSKTYRLDSTSAQARWIDELGTRLAKQQSRANFTEADYSFYVVDSSVINAFAVPGGKIYLYRGLIEKAATEDQVAGVLAHEIGHVAAMHYKEQVIKLNGLGFLAALVGGSSKTGELAANVVTYLTAMKMSRNNEYQADSLAVAYLAKDKQLSPWGMKNFLDTLDALSKNSASMPKILSTHPEPDLRSIEVKRIIENRYPAQAAVKDDHKKPY